MSDDDKEPDDVFIEGANIFFFCEVTTTTVRDLCQSLVRVSQKHAFIKLHIRSSGGCMYAGLAAHDFIRNMTRQGIQIETIALGYCASASVDILLAGSKRCMGRNAYLLIHQARITISDVTHKMMEQELKHASQYMKQTRRILRKYTEIPEEVLDVLMSIDKHLSAKKCLKYGIVHELL